MKNRNLNIAAVLTILPFFIVLVINFLVSFKYFSSVPDKSETVFVFYLFILFQIISTIIVGKDMAIKKTRNGTFIIVANILVTLFMLWLIGFSNVQG